GLGLLLERTGQQVVALDWTARGDESPGSLHFDLRIPPSVPTSVELDLPVDRVLQVSRETAVLSGPLPARAPERHLWRLDCRGRPQVDLVSLQASRPAQSPLVLAKVDVRQELAVDQLEAEFDFHIDVRHASVQELIFECDAGLRPYDISSRGRAI